MGLIRPPRFLIHDKPCFDVAPKVATSEQGLISRVCLGPEESHHLIHVLRLKPGSPVEVYFSQDALSFLGVVECFESDRAWISQLEVNSIPNQAKSQTHLLVALVKADKCELIIEKCTELETSSICFFSAKRSQYSLDPQKAKAKLQRWEKIAQTALKQCHGRSFPRLSITSSLEAAILETKAQQSSEESRLSFSRKILLHPPSAPDSEGLQQPIDFPAYFIPPEFLSPAHSVQLQKIPKHADSYIIVGPEGGLTREEVQFAEESGYIPCSLGHSVLRTETAAILGCGLSSILAQ